MADSSTMRQRNVAPGEPIKDAADATAPPTTKLKNSSRFSVLDVVRVLAGCILLSGTLSYLFTNGSFLWGYKPWFANWGTLKRTVMGPVVLTDEQLKAYDGTNPKLPIYVGLNGSLYDVSSSPHLYGPKGGYGFFAGKDATRAFVTGCFQTDLTPDLRGAEEMFMPIDMTPYNAEADAKKYSPAELELRSKLERRVALDEVKESLENWVQILDGSTGRPYFWAGTIKREPGWLEKLPRRELCESAKNARPPRGKWQKALEKKMAAKTINLGKGGKAGKGAKPEKKKNPWG